MPRYKARANRVLTASAKNPSFKRDRPIGTLRRPNYTVERQAKQEHRLWKKTERLKRWLDNQTTKKIAKSAHEYAANFSHSDSNPKKRRKILSDAKEAELQFRINDLRSKVRSISVPAKFKKRKKNNGEILFVKLVQEQGLSQQWVQVIRKMSLSGLIKVNSGTNLRQRISRIMSNYNPKAAEAFANGEELILPDASLSIKQILLSARRK